jgi:hypothetical protein
MGLFLTVVSMSLFGLAICSVVFAESTRPDATAPLERLNRAPAAVCASHFFGNAAPPVSEANVPLEALLRQIERHVRLEQQAGESFHLAPTVEALHMKTRFPLVH